MLQLLVAITNILLISLSTCQDKDHPGTDEFENIINSKAFVDKTPFIKLFFEMEPLLYMTAPRGFGKSSNLQMLKTFLNLNVNSDGSAAIKNTTRSFKLFSKKHLAIYNETSFFNRHFGEYPVLHFRFKRLVLGNTSADFVASFRDVVAQAYKEHAYLLNSSTLEKTDRERYRSILSKSRVTPPSNLTLSGKILAAFLHAHFNQSCVVLVDDFDSILPLILSNEYVQNKVVIYILSFLRSFVAFMVRNNRLVTRALITGCVRFLPPETSADATEFKTVSYSKNGKIASFFGFTESEVEGMIKKLNKNEELENVKHWYCCYTADDSNIKLFNMYSISKYFQSGKLDPYWSDAGGTESLKPIFGYHYLGNIIDDSLFTNSISIALPYEMCRFDTENVIQLRNTIKHRIIYDLSEIHKNLFMKYLQDHGYFTVLRISPVGYIYGQIPNREVRERLENFIYTTPYYIMKFDIPSQLIRYYTRSLKNLNQYEISYKRLTRTIGAIYACLTGPVGEIEVVRILYTFARDSKSFFSVQKNVCLGYDKKVDLFIVTKKFENLGQTGIYVGFDFGTSSAMESLSRIVTGENDTCVFGNEFKNCSIRTNIFLGLQLSRVTKCTVAFLYNSTNLEDTGTAEIMI